MPALLSPARAAALAAAPFTYPEVGATVGEPPAGYHGVRRTAPLRRRDLPVVRADLMAWLLQERAGVRVTASSPVVEVGSVVEIRLGLGPVGVTAPCRVVYVVDEPDRVGFAYGTLPGHPESGEEQFLVSRSPEGSLSVTVAAFSRPATRLARLGGPVTALTQRLVTDRYLRSLDRPSGA